MNEEHPFEVSIVSDLEEFRALKNAWNEMTSQNPLLSWEWMFSWWEAFQAGNDLIIILVKNRDDQLVGIVPWFKTITRSGARAIRFLGSGDACSDYMSIICSEQDRDEIEAFVAESLFESKLVQRRLARWDYIELDGHTKIAFNKFTETLTHRGCSTHQQELESSWVSDLIGPFKDFEATLKRSFRRKTRKAQKNLADPRIKFDVIHNVELLDQAWDSFCRLHQLRRKMLGQAGCFADPKFESFLKTAARRMVQEDKAGLCRVQADGNDIGFVLVFYTENTVWKYQSGMDPAASSWEPGHMMTTALIDQAIEQGCTKYDFLRGDEHYKRFWNSEQIQLFKTKVVSPRAASKFRHNIWLAGKSLKHSIVSLRSANDIASESTR